MMSRAEWQELSYLVADNPSPTVKMTVYNTSIRCQAEDSLLQLFLLTWINFNPSISNNIRNKEWDEIIHPFPNFNSATVEV